MGNVLGGKEIKLGAFILRDTDDDRDAIAIEDKAHRIIGYIYGESYQEPYISIKPRHTNRIDKTTDTVFTLKPKEPEKCPTCGRELKKDC